MASTEKKIFIRRAEQAPAQAPWYDTRRASLWRRTVQAAFVLVNIYIGVLFYLWVRYYETGGEGLFVSKPTGVEAWLPIMGLMNLKFTFFTWELPLVHTASMLLLLSFMLISLFFKKAFCSWICPIGTLSEALWMLGKKMTKRTVTLPKWLDMILRSIKYLLLIFFLTISFYFPVEMIANFMTTPYSVIADVKMMDFFRYMGTATAITIVVLLLSSLFIQNAWCRYLCPYGALTGLLSLLSPYKIRRDANACIDCGKCAKVCPARLPVDQKLQITSAECTACMTCVDICPVKDALQLSLPPQKGEVENGDEQQIAKRWKGRKIPAPVLAWLLIVMVGGTVIGAKIMGVWENNYPQEMYETLVPKAKTIGHF